MKNLLLLLLVMIPIILSHFVRLNSYLVLLLTVAIAAWILYPGWLHHPSQKKRRRRRRRHQGVMPG
jgi:hypothetical protein